MNRSFCALIVLVAGFSMPLPGVAQVTAAPKAAAAEVAAPPAAALAAVAEIDPETKAAAQRVAIGTCASCHGRQGRSIAPKFPMLAGQHAGYLTAQMHAFKTQTRGDPDAVGYMWGIAAILDDGLIAGLSDYYSHQTPGAGTRTSGPVLEKGKAIYLSGDTANGIPACAVCHGTKAEGNDNFPRLAGQHVQYLTKQLRSFQSNLRNVAVMHGVAQGMKIEAMTAVATYLESLD